MLPEKSDDQGYRQYRDDDNGDGDHIGKVSRPGRPLRGLDGRRRRGLRLYHSTQVGDFLGELVEATVAGFEPVEGRSHLAKKGEGRFGDLVASRRRKGLAFAFGRFHADDQVFRNGDRSEKAIDFFDGRAAFGRLFGQLQKIDVYRRQDPRLTRRGGRPFRQVTAIKLAVTANSIGRSPYLFAGFFWGIGARASSHYLGLSIVSEGELSQSI